MPAKPDFDAITQQLADLKANLPQPRRLDLPQKIDLIKAIGGPRTVQSIIKASRSLPLARIPFLFSSLDTQLVIDILANDMTEALSDPTFAATKPKAPRPNK